MDQEEIFCNTVIDMYHKTKQVTNPPLPSEVPVIKELPWNEVITTGRGELL